VDPLLDFYFIWKNLHIVPWKSLQKNIDQLCTCNWDIYLDHVIISNVEMAMEVLKICDVEFASRPHMLASDYMGLD